MSAAVLWAIVGTGVGIVASTLTGLFFVVRLVISKELSGELLELRTSLATLAHTAGQLASEIKEAKTEQKEGRSELHDAVNAIRQMLHQLDTRVTVLEAPARRRRQSRGAVE